MADRPALFYLDGLRKLRGEPHITSPENNPGVLKSERVYTKPRTWTPPTYGTPEPNAALAAAGCVLTHIESLGGDNLNNEYYLVYETLPGTLLSGTQLDDRGDTQTVKTQVVAQGTAADASSLLQEGSVEAVDNIRSRKHTTSVAAHSTLSGEKFNERGELVLVTDDIVAPGTAPADGLLVDADSVEPLTVQKSHRVRETVTERVALATVENRKIGRQESLLPPKFLGGDTLTITTQVVNPTTEPLALSTTVLSSIVAQQSPTKALLTNTTRPDNPYPTLTDSEMNNFAGGVAVTTTDQLVAPGTTADVGFGVVTSQVVAISTDYSEKRTARVESFPAYNESEAGRPVEAYPGIFGNGDGGGRVWVRQIVPTGETPAGTGEVLSRKAINQYEDEVEMGVISAASGVTSYSLSDINPDGSVATVTYALDGTLATPGFDVLESTERPIGAGHWLTMTRTQSGSFPTLGENEGPKLPIPARFLAGLTLSTTITTVDGTSGVPAADSGSGVLSSEVRPKEGNKFRYVKTTVSLPGGMSIASLPILTRTDGVARDADGALVTETEQILAVGTSAPTQGASVLDYKDEPLGNDLMLRTVRSLPGVGAAFPILTDYDVFDRENNVLLQETHEIVDASSVTVPAAPSGGVAITFKAIDKWRSIKITRTLIVGSIPDTYGSEPYRRPALLGEVTLVSINGAFAVNPTFYSSSIDYQAQLRISTIIGAGLSRTALTALWQPVDIRYDGVQFRLICSRVLTAAFTVMAGSETYEQAATNVTPEAYLSLVGSEIVVRSTVEHYAWGLMISRVERLTVQ